MFSIIFFFFLLFLILLLLCIALCSISGNEEDRLLSDKEQEKFLKEYQKRKTKKK